MKSYKCPHCKEKQATVIQWQTCSVAFEHNLKSGESEEVDRVAGPHEAWACPGCGEDLPDKLCEKIEKELWG